MRKVFRHVRVGKKCERTIRMVLQEWPRLLVQRYDYTMLSSITYYLTNTFLIEEYSTLVSVFPDNIQLSCDVGECVNEQDYLDVAPIVKLINVYTYTCFLTERIKI